jgi:hypothetical protein
MLVEVILPKTHAGIEGEDQDASNDRNKEGSANKGKRVDVLADYSETRGGTSDLARSLRMSKSVSYANVCQSLATTILYLRHACESSSVSTIRTKSIEHVTCLRIPTLSLPRPSVETSTCLTGPSIRVNLERTGFADPTSS